MMKNSVAQRDKVTMRGIQNVQITPTVVSQEFARASVFTARLGGSVLLYKFMSRRRDSRDALTMGINIR